MSDLDGVRRLRPDDDDLAEIVAGLNAPGEWADGDPITLEPLRDFLRDDRRLYLCAVVDGRVAGALHAHLLQHPAGRLDLYVDEVDTARSQRRRGVATAMVREAFRIAGELGAAEAWLATELANQPARELYRGLDLIEDGAVTHFTASL